MRKASTPIPAAPSIRQRVRWRSELLCTAAGTMFGFGLAFMPSGQGAGAPPIAAAKAEASPRATAALGLPGVATRTMLAVANLQSETVPAPELRAVERALYMEFSRLGRFDVQELNGTRETPPASGLPPFDPSKPQTANGPPGAVAGANYVARGTLNRVGETYAMDTEIQDVQSSLVVKRDLRYAPEGMAELLSQIPQVVSALSQGLPEVSPSGLSALDAAYGPAPMAGLSGKDGAPALETAFGGSPKPRPSEPGPGAPRVLGGAASPGMDGGESPGAPGEPLGAAREETAALTRRVKSLETDLEKQKALAKQYMGENERLKTELGESKQRAREAASQPKPPPSSIDKAKAAELAAAAKQAGLAPADKIAKLKEAVRLDPSVADYPVELAKAHYGAQDWAEAERVCQAGIAAHPAHAALRTVLGVVYYAKRDYMRAEKAYREALSVGPGDPFAQYNLALTIPKTVSDGSRNAEALKEWERYLQLAASDSGQSYYVQQAKEEMKALQAAPTGPPAAAPGAVEAGQTSAEE